MPSETRNEEKPTINDKLQRPLVNAQVQGQSNQGHEPCGAGRHGGELQKLGQLGINRLLEILSLAMQVPYIPRQHCKSSQDQERLLDCPWL